ncbi:hypothetical protein O0I10_004875 [Lichtheimia ornata]|uniref:Heterokaryon incompatibility domain-containing protein n=1 Tax=Lichtheimia ornata TaxID=688661 RepID=A0AAD7XYW2_9FUNG|nr:uncharacterized protein O0I10_004875 [Lichtheimia ornata]KAJ8659510.1 hypothetical protein O0I10_004875 [Lichtheimia ornata]
MPITSTSKEPLSDTEFDKLWTLEDTFTHPQFRLLYVPPKDEHDMMTIITPSKHEPSYVPDRKFYALSHLWGTDPKDNLWEVSDFISDEDGTTVEPIPMRQEKREAFLNLLQENPGYWWIDVLCCRTDTPPIIMRGVYGCCHTCFAMIDCPPIAIEFFSAEVLSSLDSMSSTREGWPHVGDIWKCRWFSRVWTMQELALPSSVLLLSETCDMPCYLSVDSLHHQLEYHFHSKEDKNTKDLKNHLLNMRCVFQWFHDDEEFLDTTFGSLNRLLAMFAESERSCYFAEDYVYGVLGIFGWDIPRLNDLRGLWDHFVFSICEFAKKAFWTEVKNNFETTLYGLEDVQCPETAVKHCQEFMYIGASGDVESCPLSRACNMADVYQQLSLALYISTGERSCVVCKRVLRALRSSPSVKVIWC